MDSLEQYIQSNPPCRELKRALAVQMIQRGYNYREIRDVLQVSIGFISNCNQSYEDKGVAGLKSKYWGTQGYLKAEQKQELCNWLAEKEYWTIEELVEHIEDKYGVNYQSQQSYYHLLHQAGLSWKKSQPKHPDQDREQIKVKKKKLWS